MNDLKISWGDEGWAMRFAVSIRPLYVGFLKLAAKACKPLAKALIDWYRQNKRDLPWRNTKNPYHIWLSEVMLQQTRVTTVVPYYERFLDRFPTLESLATASEQSVLQAWSGLGYYRRAKYLRASAQQIINKWNGQLPKEYDKLRALPGFGAYTAAAVSSIAFGRKHAAVDGNVLRVLTRVLDEKGNVASTAIQQKLTAAARLLVESVGPHSAGTWNQALMEVGATVCTPQSPSCDRCPINRWCSAWKAGTQKTRPVKARPRKKKRVMTSVIACEQGGQILMKQRSVNARLMPGFWELPEVEGPFLNQADLARWSLKHPKKLCKFRHSITFRLYDVSIYTAILEGELPEPFCWVPQRKLATIPLTTVTRKALAVLSPNSSDRNDEQNPQGRDLVT